MDERKEEGRTWKGWGTALNGLEPDKTQTRIDTDDHIRSPFRHVWPVF